MRISVEQPHRKSGLVRVRGGFSDTNGISPCNTILQTDEFDDATRIQMNNLLFKLLEWAMEHQDTLLYHDGFSDISQQFCENLINDVFCEQTALQKGFLFDWRKVYERKISVVISDAEYNEVLDTIEYICQWIEKRLFSHHKEVVFKALNSLFEREYVGYRFIEGRIIPITDKDEIIAIEEACQISIDGCRSQIKKAVSFLADREKKDYKNCIKESISAVESLCQVITGDKKATLSDTLKNMEKAGTKIHPALNQAFLKLYAYTCDQGGIRHAEGMFESDVTFEEAKFMLVSCSAFINYLIAEYGKRSK